MVIKVLDATLARRAVVRHAIVCPPHEAAYAEDSAIVSYVADIGEALAIAQLLGYDLRLRKAVCWGALDRARVAPHQAEQADNCDCGLQVYGKHPHLLHKGELAIVRRGIRLHRSDEEKYEEQHERIATTRLCSHLAVVGSWHWGK